MVASTTKITSGYDVAIIGGGIGGMAAARSLVRGDPKNARVTVYEMGRGPGGRSSTRKSREIPALRINHGAPFADICTLEGKKLVRELELMEFGGRRGHLDSSSGTFTPSVEDDDDDTIFVTGSNNEMANIASSLIENLAPSITTRYSSMIRSVSHTQSRWQLYDKSGSTLGSADYLIVAGSGIAHPRWTATFGGDPPLVTAAEEMNCLDDDDAILKETLHLIAKQTADPIIAVFFFCTGDSAKPWLDIGFHVGNLFGDNQYDTDNSIDDSGVLSRIVVQPIGEDGGCSVVLHSTIAFAQVNTGVYGSSSSAARVGDASSDSSREDFLIGKMLQALSDIPGMPTVDISNSAISNPLFHRWGNAFPTGEPIPEKLTFCASSRVGFCGDYTKTAARMGSVEAALLSGTYIGKRIVSDANGKLQIP